MSKSNAIGAVFGALMLSCMPAVAATTGDEVLLKLDWARETSHNHYEVSAGQVVLLRADGNPGDLMFIFAVAIDAWGEPDYGNILTLYLDYPRGGSFSQIIEIPKGLDGRLFQVLAITQDQKGEFRSSNPMVVAVRGVLVLTEPDPIPAPAHFSSPAALPTDN